MILKTGQWTWPAFLSAVFAVIFLYPGQSAHANAAAYCAGSSERELGHYTLYLRDPTQTTTLTQALQRTDQFQSVGRDAINFGATNDLFWFAVPLENCSSSSQDLLLVLNMVRAAFLEVYLEQNGSVRPVFDSEQRGSTVQNLRRYRTLSFPVTLAPGESGRFLFKMIAANNTYTPLEIKFAAEQGFDIIPKQLVLVSIMAGILAILVFNALLFVFTGMRVFLYYVIIEALSVGYLGHTTGWSTMYLWGDGPWDQLGAGLLASAITTMTGVFTREYFDTRHRTPRLDLALGILVWAGCIFMVAKAATLYLPLDRPVYINAFGYAIAYAILSLSIAAALLFSFSDIKNQGSDRFTSLLILAAWLVLTGNVAFMGFRHMDFMDYSEHYEVIFGLALLLESVLIALALALKMRGISRERAARMREVNALQAARLEQQAREQDLLLAKTLADRAALEAGELVLAVGHDGRQMLAALDNYAQVLIDTQRDTQVRRISHSIQQVSRVLSDIFGNALDGSAQHRDEESVQLEQFSADRLLAPLKLIYANGASGKGLQLRFRASNLELYSDRVVLMRIVGNLINNAIEHTQAGGVLIALRKREQGLAIQVWDTGVGIEPKQLTELFEGPIAVASGTASTQANLGIGLKACAQMAEEIGARLDISSRPGRGTLAQLVLPETALVDEQTEPVKLRA